MQKIYTQLLTAKWMFIGLYLAAALFFPRQDARAGQAPVNLGSARSFAVLAFNTITNPTGGGRINGDVGVSPGIAFDQGIPPVTVKGAIHVNDSVAAQAQTDLTAAYNDAAGRPGAASVTADIGGLTLAPGLYKAPSSLAVTGNLTLNAQGDSNAVWIFQMASTLTVANNGQVILINGAQACNVFWQVGSAATLGTNAVFKGDMLASAAITLQPGARLDGRALSVGAAVTLNGNAIAKQPPRFTDQPWRILFMN
uniref:ice-binding family protein n=1 Tax=Candidatus Electronema sp. TaxID=2698783 RepID=UPI004055EC4A